MANTLTNLIPDLYASLDVVSREQVGFIPSVLLDASAARAAVGQNVRVFKTRANIAHSLAPAMTPPTPADRTEDNSAIVITKARGVDFAWTGEEQRGLNTGAGYAGVRNDEMVQAMRALTNEVEADIAATYAAASRAYGTAGTTPFASDLSDPAQLRKILEDNGQWTGDMSLVLNSTAAAKLRTLAQLTKANEAGTTLLREQGILLDIHGFQIRSSAQVANVTKGTGTGYLVNNGAGYVVGDTAITVDTGTGTILAGDVITFAGDTNKYVVATALAGNVVTIAAPGLLLAVADNVAITVGNNFAANMAFRRGAIVLAVRQPAVPEEGDLAFDRTAITDPRSGLTFEVAMYPGYRKVSYEISLAWGVKLIKPEGAAILLG